MEIALTPRQKEILEGAFKEQSHLQTEYLKVQKRIDDVVLVILETHNIAPIQGIQIKDDVIIIPDAQTSQFEQPIHQEEPK